MALLNDLTLSQIFTRLIAFLVVIGVHGFALAGIVRLLGDPTPSYNGRLTPNPIPHLKMPALVMAVLFQVPWIAPMRVKKENLRWGRWGLAAAAAGALAVTLLTVPLLQSIRPLIIVSLPRGAALVTLQVVDTIQEMSLWLVALNWVPLPPLTGAYFTMAGFPAAERPFHRYRNVFVTLLVVGSVAGVVTYALAPLQAAMSGMLLGR